MQGLGRGAGLRAVFFGACLVVGVLAAVVTARTPPPVSAAAPAGAFSAARAMVDDRIIAKTPHPEGSPEAAAARDYIFSRMAALGLNPRRVAGEAVEVFPKLQGRFAAGGEVENLIGVLPGADPTAKAVMLMAHSDSVPGSPGAADDGAGVISALETVRALEAAGPRKRDVIVLITDGEEAGLLGARAFFNSNDPLLTRIGMIVNMEARGGGGRVAMFETGAGNGEAMRLFARTVKNTDALSLMSEVYKYLPNSTDFTVSKAAGYPGYNFAFVGEQFDYHSPSSTPAALDQGSVQHMGDQALALTSALADAPVLPARGPDAIYSDVLGGPVIVYSAAVGWAILGLAGVLAVVGAVIGARREGEPLRVGEIARGVGVGLCSLLTVALVLHLASRWMGDDFVRGRNLLAQFGLLYAGVAALGGGAALLVWGAAFQGRWRWLLAGSAVIAGLLTSLSGGFDPFGMGLGIVTAILAAASFGGPLKPWSGWLGVLVVGVLATLALQLIAPPLTVATAWPLLIGAAGILGVAVAGRELGASLSALVAGAVVSAQLGHIATTIFTAVGPTTPEAMALIPLLGALALYPLLGGWSEARGGRIAAATLFALGAAGLVIVAVRDPASARTPRPVQAFYFDDAAGGREWRASTLDRLDPWSRAALAPDGGGVQQLKAPPLFDTLWLAPAPPVRLMRPTFDQTAASSSAGPTHVVTITPHDGGRELRLYLQSTTPLADVTLNGHPTELAPKPGAWVQLRWLAPAGPITLGFAAKGPGALDLRYEEITDGGPKGLAAPAKPADDMPWGLSDKTVLADRFQLRW